MTENVKGRAGASSGQAQLGKEVGPDDDMMDLFLSEENLIRLAMGHLGGRRPPKTSHTPMLTRSGVVEGSSSGTMGQSLLKNLVQTGQPARVRKAIAAKLKRELEARGWTTFELSERTRLGASDCRALLSGAGWFTPDVAAELAKIFATSENYWMNDGPE